MAKMAKTSTFLGLFLCYIIGSLAGLMAIGISASVAQEIIKIDAATAATLVGVFAIFNGVGRPIFGVLTDKLSPKIAALISFVLILVCSLGMLMAGPGSVMLYTLCFVGFWLVLGGWLAIAPTATTSFFGVKNYAKNYGLGVLRLRPRRHPGRHHRGAGKGHLRFLHLRLLPDGGPRRPRYPDRLHHAEAGQEGVGQASRLSTLCLKQERRSLDRRSSHLRAMALRIGPLWRPAM